MAAFIQNSLTLKGLSLLAKAQTGAQITFTRIAIGDGFNKFNSTDAAALERVEALVSPIMDLDINKCKVAPTGNAVVGAVFSNQTIPRAFNFREWGLFALDPDEGEILYAYVNCGKVYNEATGNTTDNSEYIPMYGSAAIVEKNISFIISVAGASRVQAFLSSQVYASIKELEEVKAVANEALAKAIENHNLIVEYKAGCDESAEMIYQMRVEVNSISAKINTLWNAVFSNIKDNAFEITFATLDQILLTNGIWNQKMARLEC